MDIKWITENYIESKEECVMLLSQFERDGVHTKEELIAACKEIRKADIGKRSLSIDLKILHEMGLMGMNAHDACVLIRDTLLNLIVYLKKTTYEKP